MADDTPDRSLIEWTANAHMGDVPPEPYSRAPNATFAVARRLVDAGVMPDPSGEATTTEVAELAQRACRDWLAAHPS